ncbi:MAG TPA: choice-of-anchor Q domain-containing protein, partial [Pyrinomonadaceae bacterium]
MRGNVSPRKVDGRAVVAAPAPLVGLIGVNTTSDADNLDPNTGCDTDAATPGEQCSLRAAIQRANALAGDDEIDINIPSTQPNCDPTGAHCTINLTKALPDLSTNIRIISQGIDKVTVRRNTTTEFSVFRIVFSSDVTLSGLRLTNGKPFGIAAGGAVAHDGTGIVNVIDSVLVDNIGGSVVASGGALANNNSGTLNVINCSIAGNQATSSGGGVINGSSGTLNVIGSIIFQNTVTIPSVTGAKGSGGGISNVNQGTVNITNSVVGENVLKGGDPATNPLRGGGVANISNGTLNVSGSVIYGNQMVGTSEGGGIYNATGAVNVSNSTITANRGKGGGLFGPTTVKSSIIAKNNLIALTGGDVSGTFTSEGYNLIGVQDGSTGFTSATDLKGTVAAPLDPKFDPNGVELSFPALTWPVPGLPLCGSPAIDKGTSNGLNTDLRGAGFPRIVDDPDETNAGDGADIGAFERQTPCAAVTFTVNTTSDADDTNPGDHFCDTDAAAAGSQCSLRAAMKESNAIGGDYTINFAIPTNDPGFDPATNRHTINLTGALPEITQSNLTINGPGKDKLTVRRNTGGFYRIFSFGNVVETATIAGMTVSNGFNSVNDGGAISFTGKTLTINGCVFSNNIAAGSGGALYVFAKLNVTNSFFNDNFSSAPMGGWSGGGAILVRGALNVSNSTFNNNIANSLGGGINADTSGLNGGDSTITNTQFTGNSGDAGGGVAVGTQVGVNPNAMRIINSTFNRNISTIINSKGGGIYHGFGTLHVIGSTLKDNECYGITMASFSAISTNIVDSTITGNTFGGIETEFATVPSGTLNVTNSTISGNKGNGGIFISKVTLNVSNSTITGNEGAGIRNTLTGDAGTWTVRSSIVAANAGFTDVSGAFASGGFNLIGNPFNSTGFANGVNNDQVGANGAPLDPKLDPLGLKDNGGTTQTIALQADSPAIDKGSSSDGTSRKLDNDQRQVFERTFDDPAIANADDGTDVGAFESQPGGPTPTPTPTPSPSPLPSPSPSPSPNPSPSPTPSPTPTPTPQPATLIVTVTSMVRSNCGSLAVGVTVQNVGGVTANNVKLTTGTLTQPST